MIISILSYLIVALALTFSSFIDAHSSANDAERITDVNAIHTGLEYHFLEHETYPEANLEQTLDNAYVEHEGFVDPHGNILGSQDSEYEYIPGGCANGSCQTYELKTKLSDGTEYIRKNLN